MSIQIVLADDEELMLFELLMSGNLEDGVEAPEA